MAKTIPFDLNKNSKVLIQFRTLINSKLQKYSKKNQSQV